MANTIYLIRHGEIPDEFQHRYIGKTDPPLSEDGKKNCSKLSDIECDIVWVSPLRRAKETAEFIEAPVKIDCRLAEIDFGKWENLTFNEISLQTDAEVIKCWLENPEAMQFPDGESVLSFYKRIDEVFAAISATSEDDVAMVTHGGAIMRILSCIRQLEPAQQFKCLIPRGSMVKLIKSGEKWHEE